jgi:urease accessory protein UreF
MTHPMAAQMAQLLVDSDLEELEEIVARWTKDAQTESLRNHYRVFGAKLLQLKRHLVSLPQHPSREDLEVALSMMLDFAAQQKGPPS